MIKEEEEGKGLLHIFIGMLLEIAVLMKQLTTNQRQNANPVFIQYRAM
jgi:hypothetical protein